MPPFDWSTVPPYQKPPGEKATDALREGRRIAREVDADMAKLREEAETNAGLRIVLGLDDATDER